MGKSSQFGNSKSIFSMFFINIHYSISNISVSNPLYTKRYEVTFQSLTEDSGAEGEKIFPKHCLKVDSFNF